MCFDAITSLLHKSLELKITCVKKYYEELNFFLNEIDIFYFKTLSIPPKWPDHFRVTMELTKILTNSLICLAIIDLVGDCIIFAFCCSMLGLQKNRYVPFYRDLSFYHVTDFSKAFDRNITSFTQWILWCGVFIALGRMIASQLILFATIFEKRICFWPQIIIGTTSVVFTLSCIITGYALSTQSKLSDEEVREFHGSTMTIICVALLLQIGHLALVGIQLYKMYSRN